MPGEFLLKYGQQFKLDWFLLSGGSRRRLKSKFLAQNEGQICVGILSRRCHSQEV